MSKEDKKKEVDRINFEIGIQVLDDEYIDDLKYRFRRVKFWFMHLGYNENKNMNFEKAVVDQSIESLKNIPIVAKIIDKSNGDKDFGSHEIKVKDGKIVKDTEVMGVIPETNNANYEVRICDDYVERTFLTVEGLLWTNRNDDLQEAIWNSDGASGHSMELDPNLTEFEVGEDGVINVTRLVFDGACILGDHVESAMINSEVQFYYSKDINLSSELEEILSNYFSYKEKEKEIDEKEGGENMAKDKKKEDVEVVETETKETVEEDIEEAVEVKEDETKEGVEAVEKVEDKVETVETKVEQVVETEVPTLPSDFAKLQAEIKDLQEFKANALEENRKREVEAIFSKYDEVVGGVEEYKTLQETAKTTTFSAEEVETKIGLIIARNVEHLNYSVTKEENVEDELDSGLVIFNKSKSAEQVEKVDILSAHAKLNK